MERYSIPTLDLQSSMEIVINYLRYTADGRNVHSTTYADEAHHFMNWIYYIDAATMRIL
jgi:hypothetical protein